MNVSPITQQEKKSFIKVGPNFVIIRKKKRFFNNTCSFLQNISLIYKMEYLAFY